MVYCYYGLYETAEDIEPRDLVLDSNNNDSDMDQLPITTFKIIR